ncbi:uncharacterized protein LOC105889174 isoform X2 [Clupea harengus]|uniref:Uncharacterized protein LOC105889174 isoform X2 n=1 Tax=Clupea harengus TaxID=7950 RepID=A0A8M1K929_CLUHA|nr:uncharacterized protein LOC105889174 isoform X2 [Clupea harengus]
MSSRKSKKRIGSTRQRNLGHKAEERDANEELTETITETPDEASNAGKTGVLQELSTVHHVQPLYSGEVPKCQLDVVSENIEGDQHDPGKTSTEKLETGAPAELCEAETSTSGKIRRMGSTRRTKQAFKAEERKEEEEKDNNSMQIIQEEFNITRTEDQYLKEEPHAPESDQAHTHLLELGVSEVKGLTERPRDESPGEERRLLSELDVKTEAQYTHSPPQSFDQCPTPAVNPPFCVTSPQEEGESLLKQSCFNLSEAKEISSTDTTQDTPEGLDGHYQQREDQSPEDVRESDEQRRTEEVVLEVSQEKDTNSELNVQRPKKRMGSTRRIVKGNKMIEDIGNSQEETHEMREDTLLNPELTEEDTKFRLKTVVNDKLDMVFTVNERGAQLEEAGCEFEEQENKHGNLILDENTEGTLIAMDAEAFHSTENITGDSGTMTSTSSRQLVMEGNLDHHHNEIGRKGVTEIAELNAPRLRERLGSTHEPLQGEKEVKREYGCDLTGKEIDSKDIDFQMIPGTDILAIVKSGKLQVEDIGTESFTDKPTVGSVCESFSPFENDFLASPPMVDHREEMVDNSLNLQGESFDCTKTCMSDKDAVEKAEYFTNQSEVRIPSDTFSSFEVAEHFKGAFVREDVDQLQKHDEGKAENSPESPEDQERKNSTNMAVSEQPEIENQLSCPSEDPCENCAGTSAEVIGAIENTNILLPQSEVEILSESFDPLEQNRWSSSTPDHIPEIAVASLNVRTESSSPETYSPDIQHCDEVEKGTQAHILSSTMEPEVSNTSTNISDALHNEQTKQSVSQSLTMESTDTSEKTSQYDDCESTFKLPYHTEEANVKPGASKQKRKMGSTRRTKREQKREETSEVMSTDGDYANEDINVKMNTDADIKVDAEEGILEAGIIDALKENEPSTTQTDVGLLKMALSCVEQDRYVDCSPSAEVMSSSVPQCNPLEDGQKQDNQHQCLDITAQQLDGNDAANLEADNEISILGKETSEGLTTSEAEPFNEALMSKDVDQLKKHEEEKAEKSLESLGDQNKEDSISLRVSEQAEAVNRLSSPTEVHSPDCAAITVEDVRASEKTESSFCQSGVGTHGEALDPLEQEHPPSSPTPDHIPEITVASLDVHTESSSLETYNPEIEHCDEVEQGTQAHILSSTMDPEVPNNGAEASELVQDGWTQQSDHCESSLRLQHHEKEGSLKQSASRQKRKMGSTRRQKRETNEVNLDEETKSSHETGEMTETEIEVQQEENIQSEQISSREKIHSAGVNTIPMSIGQIEISESSGSTAAEETSYSQLSHEDSQKEPKSMLQKRKMGSSRRGQGLGNRGKGEAEQVDEHMDDTSRQESGGALLQNEGTSKESCSGLLKNTQDLPVEGEQLLASVQSSESHLQPLAQAERPDELIDERVPPASAQSKPSVLSVSSSPSSEFQEHGPNKDPQTSTKKRKMGSTRKNMRRQGEEDKSDLKAVHGSTQRWNDDTVWDSTISDVEDLPTGPTETATIQKMTETQGQEDTLPHDESAGHGSAGQKKSPQRTRRKMGSRHGGQGYRGIGGLEESEDQPVCKRQEKDGSILQGTQENVHSEGVDEQGLSKLTFTGDEESQKVKQPNPSGARSKLDLERKYGPGDTLTSLEEAVMFNIVMVGESSVGKTSFIHQFQNGQFFDDHSATIGVDTCIQTLAVDGELVKLQIWDTAGQERFHSLTRQVLHKADGLIVMYDISSSQTFCAVRKWISCIEEGARSEVLIMLLGNKNDSEERQVLHPEGERLAQEHNFHFMECSAATGHNVPQAMEALARLLKQTVKESDEEHVTLHKKPQQKKSGCC